MVASNRGMGSALAHDDGSGDRKWASNADRMRHARKSQSDLTIPTEQIDWTRRRQAEADMLFALRTYFGDIFYREFTAQQAQIVHAIERAAQYGGDQAIAAPRGEGKTTIAECVVIMLVLRGLVRFPLIVAATGPDSRRVLDNMKRQLENNELLLNDYPHVCHPIAALEGKAQRSPGQTVEGVRTFLRWKDDHVILPTVAGSKCSGSVLMTRGLDAAIRGIRVGPLRPDLVVIDDPETRESAASEVQIAKRQLTIDEDLAGVGGPGKRIARLMLTTIMRQGSVSDIYTDPAQKPSWSGKRLQFVEAWPERADLWDEYVSLRQQNQQSGDPWGRGAHAFLVENFDEMHKGAKVANERRYVAEELPDGTQQQASAVQYAFDWIADKGRESFDCELQNSPPVETEPIDSGLSSYRVQRQVSGYARKVIPTGAVILTQGIDVRKVALHWVVRAWHEDGSGSTIDYGVEDVHGTRVGSDEGLDAAIVRALQSRFIAVKQSPYMTAEGVPMPLSMTLIDAGYRTDAIYAACSQLGRAVRPSMGFGKSAGCAGANFNMPHRKGRHRKLGDGWFLQKQPSGVWLVAMDADRWKSYEHDRWLTSPGQSGCMTLFGLPGSNDRMSPDEHGHHSYARHITAESEVEEVIRGRIIRHWKSKRDNNHWLDASYMACVAAAIEGCQARQTIDTAAETAAPEQRPAKPDERKPLRELRRQ